MNRRWWGRFILYLWENTKDILNEIVHITRKKLLMRSMVFWFLGWAGLLISPWSWKGRGGLPKEAEKTTHMPEWRSFHFGTGWVRESLDREMDFQNSHQHVYSDCRQTWWAWFPRAMGFQTKPFGKLFPYFVLKTHYYPEIIEKGSSFVKRLKRQPALWGSVLDFSNPATGLLVPG